MFLRSMANVEGMRENKLCLCLKNIRFPLKKNKAMKLLIGMRCLCSKGLKDENKGKDSKKSSKRLAASSSSRKEEDVVDICSGGNNVTTSIISKKYDKKSAGSTLVAWEDKPVVFENYVETGKQEGKPQICRVLSVQNGKDGAQIVAGWPSWLTAAAGEAIAGWIPRSAESFEKLDKIGQGTYSSVYRACDLQTGKNVALKKVRFIKMDPESVRFMAREILILRRLNHPNVMKLQGLVTSKVSGNLYLVFEYMEHDLAGLAASTKVKFTEPQIKCYMQQFLHGLEHCHNRGVLHRDIKGSNILIDNNGNLKIADFGLATFFRSDQKQPLTSRVVTLWYRPPELLLGATDYGVGVDLWSSGCILGELFTGKPIMPGRTEVEQLHKIFKLCGSPAEEYWKKSKLQHSTIFKPQQPYIRCVAETFKDFPSSALALVESLLAFEPEYRGSTTSALQTDFFTTKPLPCDPSSLPKYPPSKELDAKVRDEEARRQKMARRKKVGLESSRKGSKDPKAAPAPDVNAEMQASIQEPKAQSNSKSNNEQYNLKEVNSQAAFDSFGYKELKTQSSYKPEETAARLSRFSNSVAARGCSKLEFSRDTSLHSQWQAPSMNDNANSSRHLFQRPDFYHKVNGKAPRKEKTMSYSLEKTCMHYSGPLLPHGGNVDEMLKEHEKGIQIAVRKVRDKNKVRKDNGQHANSTFWQ